ncbi:MAG: Gfo/Idh/MocA family oxidoreductase [Bryobacterales bacterium]|nr:Gfo/Idh/MocA family oxidoreductase [Bryobacterales bacterium]
MQNKHSRRFFFGALGAAAMSVAPLRGKSAQIGANSTINLGLIGCGARGRGVIVPNFGKMPGVRFTAVCDVNSKYLAEVRERAGGQRVAAYADYRKLVEDKNVDAVVIATNQQWHVLQMIAALRAGKDVYLEKPLGQSIGEGPVALAAAKKYGRIVQVGTQQRSQEHYQKAVELIQAGRLGTISEVQVWDYENYYPGSGFPADCPPPSELDWDMYVGPSPFRAYNPNMYYKYGYDWFRVAGAGHQVAWGVHHFDVVLWAMGVKSPKSVSAMGRNYAYEDNHEYPNTFSATVEFGPGPVSKQGFLLRYMMRTGGKRDVRAHGKCFIGTEASMILDRAGFSIVKEIPAGQKITSTGPYVNAEETMKPSDDVRRHMEGFIANVRDRKQPNATVETLHHSTAVGHLMNMSWETGRTLRWDGEQNKVVGDAEAQKLVMRPYRAPWKLVV